MKWKQAGWLVIGVSLLIGCARHAAAQVIDAYFPAFVGSLSGNTVLSRPHPEDQNLGVRLGSFVLQPRLTESIGYDSNLDGVPNGHGSPVIESQASTGIASDWSRNSLDAYFGVDDRRYPSRSIQNETDWTASLGGSHQIGNDQLFGSYNHLELTERPGDLGATDITRALPFSVDDIRLGYTIGDVGRFSFTPDVNFRGLGFSSSLLTNGAPDSQRDRDILQAELTSRYEFSPQRDLLVVLRGTQIDYTKTPVGSISGNSNGVSLLTGLDYAATGVFRYRFLVGYQIRDYVNRQVSNLSAPTVEASVMWFPSGLTAVTATARRDIEDAADESLAGFTYTSGRLSVEHEYRRNLLLNGYVEVQHGDFRATGRQLANTPFAQSASTQNVYQVGAGATWLISSNLRASLQGGIADRSGAGAGSYRENSASLSLTFVI
jgi:hypothetical protein